MTFIKGSLAILLYLIIIFSAMQSHVLLGVVAVVVFTLTYSGIALLPLAILLDGYYGSFFTVPWFSVAAIAWYLLSEIIRVRLSIVQSEYE